MKAQKRPFHPVLVAALLLAFLTPAAFAALCGSSPATTSPGYHCSNSCQASCPQKSCSTSCCDWIEDPNGELVTWGQTTCGGSPYPCDDCGNTRCGGCESYSGYGNTTACRADCTNGAAADRNACVPHVVSKFNRISSHDKQFKINNGGCCSHGQIHWANLADAGLADPCHFQGIARLRDNPWIAMVANNTDTHGNLCATNPTPYYDNGPQLFIARMGSKSSAGDGSWGSGWSVSQDQVQHHLPLGNPPDLWHPGGMQAVGDYLLFGIDSTGTTLYTIDVTDPDIYTPHEVVSATTVLDYLGNQTTGGPNAGNVSVNAVAAVQDADGHYLVATNFNNGSAWMFRSQNADIESPDYRYLGPILWSPASSIREWDGSGMVRECGTDDLYLVTFYNTKRTGIGGTNMAQLWSLDVRADEVIATHVRARSFDDAGSAFFAGVGLYIQGSSGRMAIYSSERFPHGSFLGGNNDLDCDEWW
ncbi:MAG: hypothetical protein KDD47_04610 [Acidobacteria bacterium]|nr:hypothetical protein [Acidobacteriota bacterium]